MTARDLWLGLSGFVVAAVPILLVPLLLFEEWGWAPLAAQAAKLARLPLWARLEQRVRAMPPWAAPVCERVG